MDPSQPRRCLMCPPKTNTRSTMPTQSADAITLRPVTLLDALDQSREAFVWKDGERLIAFGGSALASLPGFLRAAQMEQYALLVTDRSLDQFAAQVGGDEAIASA